MIGCENNAKKTFCFDFLFLSNLSMVGLKANNFKRCSDCLDKVCNTLQNQVWRLINFEEKKMIPISDEGFESWKSTKISHICEDKFPYDWDKNR